MAWADLQGPAECAPIFIVGTERSGSNLLRLMLDAHSRICVPHPPHLIRYLAPIEASYGDLGHPELRRQLVRDAIRLVGFHPHPWPHPISVEDVLRDASPSVVGILAAIYETYRRHEGKARWGCKSTFVVEHIDEVYSAFPQATFLWLVRDPRDVAASSRNAVFGPCEPIRTARLWARQQEMAVAAAAELGGKVVPLVRYEDLTREPERTLRRICDLIGERFEPAMMAPQTTHSASQISALSASWAETARAPHADRIGRYKRDLSAQQLFEVEDVVGRWLEPLGYDPPQGALSSRRVRREWVIATQTASARLQVEWRSLRHDTNHWQRWRREAFVRYLVMKARLRDRRRCLGATSAIRSSRAVPNSRADGPSRSRPW